MKVLWCLTLLHYLAVETLDESEPDPHFLPFWYASVLPFSLKEAQRSVIEAARNDHLTLLDTYFSTGFI